MAKYMGHSLPTKNGAGTLLASETRQVWAVWTNTDLTEGRGQRYACYYTLLESTARRLARRNYVQGTDCPISQETMYLIDGSWYAPGTRLVPATREDEVEDAKLIERQQVLRRARELGLSEDELAILQKNG